MNAKYTAYFCSTVNDSDLLKHRIKYNLFLKVSSIL